MDKIRKVSAGSFEALKALKEVESATAKDLKDAGLEDLNAAHLTALVNRGFVDSIDVVMEVPTIVKRKVKLYSVTPAGMEYKGE